MIKSLFECARGDGSDEKANFGGFDHSLNFLNFFKKAEKKTRVKKNTGIFGKKNKEKRTQGVFFPKSLFFQKIQTVVKNPKIRFFVRTNTFNALEKEF